MHRVPEATRRLFLRCAVFGAGASALSACGDGEAESLPPGAAAPQPTSAPSPAPTSAPTPAPTPAPGNIVNADPSNYLARLAALRAGDTLLLAPGNYGITAGGGDTAEVPGLPVFNLNGTAAAPIVIRGPASGPMPVLMGRATHNTVRFSNASHIVVRRLEIDGRDLGGAGVAVQGPCHDITIEDCRLHGFGADQQVVAISTTGQPTWGWIVRRNLIVGAGTGMYFGNSNGDSPFVAGLVEYNVVRDTIGYCMQVKRQAPWSTVPVGMPTGKTSTIIRHNVFAKSGNSSAGVLARPNLLVGDGPPSGPGSSNDFVVYGNLLHENPSEALFQCEGNVACQPARHQRHSAACTDARRRGAQHPHLPQHCRRRRQRHRGEWRLCGHHAACVRQRGLCRRHRGLGHQRRG